ACCSSCLGYWSSTPGIALSFGSDRAPVPLRRCHECTRPANSYKKFQLNLGTDRVSCIFPLPTGRWAEGGPSHIPPVHCTGRGLGWVLRYLLECANEQLVASPFVKCRLWRCTGVSPFVLRPVSGTNWFSGW